MVKENDLEPFMDDELYRSLIRDDSLLARTGSNNFSLLIDDTPQQDNQPQQSQYSQHTSQLLFSIDTGYVAQENQQPSNSDVQVNEDWHDVNTVNELVIDEGPKFQQEMEFENRPETSVARTVPCLQPWQGLYGFRLSIPTDNKDKNKWCYAEALNKLFLNAEVAVPVQVSLNNWVNATIRITPIYEKSRDIMEPVHRCYNCMQKMTERSAVAEYIVQVDGEGCEYQVVEGRQVVDVPLQHPPPGEVCSTMLIKIMCLTSCIGGPNRRPFCLQFTLIDSANNEVGRQIVKIKCCKCPGRDMGNEEKTIPGNSPAADPQVTKVTELASTIRVGQKRRKLKIEVVEPDAGYVNLPCPTRFLDQVKLYINNLVAMEYTSQMNPQILPFTDDL